MHLGLECLAQGDHHNLAVTAYVVQVADLKKHLKDRGLSNAGRRTVLQVRLLENLEWKPSLHPDYARPSPHCQLNQNINTVCSECGNMCPHLLRCQGDRFSHGRVSCESSLCQDCVCFLLDKRPGFAETCAVGDAAAGAARVRARVLVPTLTFCMSQHNRLGSRATVPPLNDLVLSLISRFVSSSMEDLLPWASKKASPPGEEETQEIQDDLDPNGICMAGVNKVWDSCHDCDVPLCPQC